jgi:hypothetical protein
MSEINTATTGTAAIQPIVPRAQEQAAIAAIPAKDAQGAAQALQPLAPNPAPIAVRDCVCADGAARSERHILAWVPNRLGSFTRDMDQSLQAYAAKARELSDGKVKIDTYTPFISETARHPAELLQDVLIRAGVDPKSIEIDWHAFNAFSSDKPWRDHGIADSDRWGCSAVIRISGTRAKPAAELERDIIDRGKRHVLEVLEPADCTGVMQRPTATRA